MFKTIAFDIVDPIILFPCAEEASCNLRRKSTHPHNLVVARGRSRQTRELTAPKSDDGNWRQTDSQLRRQNFLIEGVADILKQDYPKACAKHHLEFKCLIGTGTGNLV